MRLLLSLIDWLVIEESQDRLLQHRELVLQLCQNLRIIVDLQPSTRVQYMGILRDTSLSRVFPSQACLARFWEVATSFLQLPSPPGRMCQQLLGHMVLLECFFLRGRTRMRPLQWHLKDCWSPMVDDPANQIPLSQECIEAVLWWLQEDRWLSGVPLQVPVPVPVIVYRCVSVGLGDALSGSDGLRGLVQGRKRRAHQCAGDEGSSAGSGCPPASAVRTEYRPDERQRLSCHFSPASG